MEEKKSRIGIIIVIVAAVAAMAGSMAVAVGIILSKTVFLSPELRLGKGFMNMAEEMKAYTTSVSDDIDFKALAEAGKSQPVHSSVDVSLTNPDQSGPLGNVSLEFDSVTDIKNKQGKIDMKAGAYGFDMELGSIIADNNTLYLASDLFFKGDVYSVGLKNIGRDFNDSVWADYLGADIPEDTSITLFEDGADTYADIYKDELASIFVKHLKEMAASAECAKIEERKEFSEAGGSASYDGVRVTIEKGAYNTFMENLKDDVFASSFYSQYLEQCKKIYADNFDMYKDALDKVVEVATGIKAEDDIVLDFYLDTRGRVRNIATSDNVNMSFEGSRIGSVTLNIDFTGEERRLDSVEGGICYYTEAGIQVLEMGISRAASVTGDSYDEDLTLRLGDGAAGEMIFSYINNWTYADKSYDMKVMVDYNEGAIRFSARGGYEDIRKGSGFTLRLDNATLNVDTKDVLIVSGNISMETVENSGIEVPSNAIDALKMSGMDIMAAAMKAAAALEKFQ